MYAIRSYYDILNNIEQKLKSENIFIVDETQIEDFHKDFIKNYFIRNNFV